MAKAQRKEEEESKDAPAPAAPEAVVSAQAVEPWEAPPKLGRTSLYVVLGVVVLFNLPLLHYFLLRSPMATIEPTSRANSDQSAKIGRELKFSGRQILPTKPFLMTCSWLSRGQRGGENLCWAYSGNSNFS